MLEIIGEFLLEFLLEFVGPLIFDVFVHAGARIPSVNRAATSVFIAVLYFAIGAFVGWVSLWFFPRAFVRSEALHGISLIVTPVLAGAAMAAIGWVRKRPGKLVVRIETFSYAFALAFGIALIRFYFT